MFNLFSLLRKKPADVLTNLKVADRWMQTIIREDAYEAQKKVIDALNVFMRSQEPPSKERLKALLFLDEGSQQFQSRLSETYFKRQTELKGAEDALWKSMTTLFSLYARAYQMFIREVMNQQGQLEFTRFLPTITARALRYYALSIKWGYFHQEPVQPAMWKRLHKYYLMCEKHDFAATEVSLTSQIKSTCANQYLQILLLDMVKPMMLKPAQIDTVDRWLDKWSPLVVLEQDCDPETHMHCVDLGTGTGARKLMEDMHGPKLRCWSMAEVYLRIRKSRNSLSEGDFSAEAAPSDRNKVNDSIHLLDYVARYWIRPEAARRQYRMPVEDRLVEMACGVGAIYSCLQPDENTPHKVPFVHWSVQDESEGGYGLVEAAPTERAEEGKLVLVKPPGHNGSWEIGVVRWKKDSETGAPALGIERLSDDPKQVDLTPINGSPENTIKAVFLPKMYQRGIDSSLILQTRDYRDSLQLEMRYRNNVFHIRLTEVVDNSDEWVRVQFIVMGNSATPLESK